MVARIVGIRSSSRNVRQVIDAALLTWGPRASAAPRSGSRSMNARTARTSPRDGGHIEGGSPAECAGDDPAPGEAGGDADRGTGGPDRHGAPTPFLLEV